MFLMISDCPKIEAVCMNVFQQLFLLSLKTLQILIEHCEIIVMHVFGVLHRLPFLSLRIDGRLKSDWDTALAVRFRYFIRLFLFVKVDSSAQIDILWRSPLRLLHLFTSLIFSKIPILFLILCFIYHCRRQESIANPASITERISVIKTWRKATSGSLRLRATMSEDQRELRVRADLGPCLVVFSWTAGVVRLLRLL